MSLTGTSIIESTGELHRVLDRITFRKSCVDFDWRWEVEALPCADCTEGCKQCLHTRLRGWLVNTTFKRPDTDSGRVERGRGRQEYVAIGTTVSGLVKTCWVLTELIVRHELMEAFCFDGARVFDPHKTVEQLTADARQP
jgi:hypothetical protein